MSAARPWSFLGYKVQSHSSASIVAGDLVSSDYTLTACVFEQRLRHDLQLLAKQQHSIQYL